MSKDIEEEVILIKSQVAYLRSIMTKIKSNGEHKLTAADLREIDMIAQTLNAFRLFLFKG